jgi:hypothetical protein
MSNSSKTNYSVMVFHKDKNIKPLKYPFVKSIFYTHKYLQNIGFDYAYMNIYHRKTQKYLGRQYSNNFIIDKPVF